MRPVYDRLSTGILIGAVFTLLLSLVLDSGLSDEVKGRWVEIFGIFAALLAAVLALLGVQKQIRVQAEATRDERRSELRASIAVLPLVLSEFVQVSEACFEASISDATVIRGISRRQELLAMSNLDNATLEVLRDCIRFSDDISAGWLSALVRHYQICRSRFASLVCGSHILRPVNQCEMACDWAVLRSIANHLFEFSRGEVQAAPRVLDPETIRLPRSARYVRQHIYAQATEMIADRRSRYGAGIASNFFD